MTANAPSLPPAASATLAVLCAEEEIAKRIENHLRNAGHPVRAAWITDLEDFGDLLQRAPPDLVFCSVSLANVSAPDVVRLCSRIAPDLPTLFLATGDFSMADSVAALSAGARDLVAAGDDDQLQHLGRVCLRELQSHHLCRELRNTRARLADSESRHRSLLAGTGDAVVHVQEGIVTHANGAFATLLGHDNPDQFEGNPLMDLVAESSQKDVKVFLKAIAQGKKPRNSKVELHLRTREGRDHKVTAQVSIGEVQGERLLELLIRAEAPPPPPPPAPPIAQTVPEPVVAPPPPPPAVTRPDLLQTLELAITANVGMHRALAVLMVDSFASIEQRLGYRESEAVLEQIGAMVLQRLSAREPMFRFSTALFAMVISRPNHDEFTRLAEILRQDIAAQLFKTRQHETHLSATVVCYPLSAGDSAEAVIDTTVGETRKRSREGGNRVAIVGKTAEAAQVALEDQKKAEQVKKALMENRLKLAYQSIASLEGDDRQHFDVLARMLDEAGHEVPAKEFIPAAERHGVIVAVDRWVIGRALGVLSKRQGAVDQSSLFVRISEQTLREADAFLRWFTEQSKLRRVNPHELVIAVTETVVETHVSKAKALCAALKEAGVDLALDRFGVGTKSEQMLDYVPATFVRFDYAFSREFEDPARQKKLEELMGAARKRGVKTIMGQVEHASAMARLWQLGVNYIQGYHIQAPEAVLLSAELRR